VRPVTYVAERQRVVGAFGSCLDCSPSTCCSKPFQVIENFRVWNLGVGKLLFQFTTTLFVVPINQPTRCNNFSSLLLDVYVQLNIFRASSRLSSGAQQLQLHRPDHDQQNCYHHAPTVKPEAATAVVELLTMGVRTPETCRAAHKT
jgi:hypothetical protein